MTNADWKKVRGGRPKGFYGACDKKNNGKLAGNTCCTKDPEKGKCRRGYITSEDGRDCIIGPAVTIYIDGLQPMEYVKNYYRSQKKILYLSEVTAYADNGSKLKANRWKLSSEYYDIYKCRDGNKGTQCRTDTADKNPELEYRFKNGLWSLQKIVVVNAKNTGNDPHAQERIVGATLRVCTHKDFSKRASCDGDDLIFSAKFGPIPDNNEYTFEINYDPQKV